MNMVPVRSSDIVAIGYDAGTREMHVQFKRGAVYAVSDVDAHEHKAFMGASSHGKHYAGRIRKKFATRQIS